MRSAEYNSRTNYSRGSCATWTSWLAFVVTAICVSGTPTAAQVPPSNLPTGTLIWNNEDRLPGHLESIRDGVLAWRSPHFATSLQVDTQFLNTVRLDPPAGDSTKLAGEHAAGNGTEQAPPFRVETAAGDVLMGWLGAVDQETVQLSSPWIGDVRLKRQYVREIRQLRHSKVVYDGPRWLEGWRVLKVGRRLDEWETLEHGSLRTTKYSGELYHDLPQLEQAEINLVLRWSKRPGFQVDFASLPQLISSRPRPRLSIKSWGDDVVAQSALDASDFQPLLKLTARQRTLRLRLVWDAAAGEVTFFGAGRRLGSVAVEKTDVNEINNSFGVLVKNRSDDLILEQLRVSKWNGLTKSEDRRAGQGYVRLADGRLITQAVRSVQRTAAEDATAQTDDSAEATAGDTGTPAEINPDADAVRGAALDVVRPATEASAETGTQQPSPTPSPMLELDDGSRIPLEQVAVWELQPTARRPALDAHVRMHDGSELAGDVQQLDDGLLMVQTPIANAAIALRAEQLSIIRFLDGRTSEYDFHLRIAGQRRLSGNLSEVSNERPAPEPEAVSTGQRQAGSLGWLAVGARQASPLAAGVPFELERRQAAAAVAARTAGELIYLRDESLINGDVQGIVAGQLQIKTDYSAATGLPIESLSAIEMLKGAGRVSFASSDWELLSKPPLHRSHERLEVAATTSMRDLRLEHGGRISFECAWDADFVGLMSVYMGTAKRQPRRSVARFSFSRDHISARCLLSPSPTRALEPRGQRQARVSIVAADRQVRIFVNGELAVDTKVDDRLAERGIWLQCGSARGAGGQRRPDQPPPRLVIERLRVGQRSSGGGLSFASDEQLDMLLQLPRNRRDDVPDSVLCSKNGDLLRGQLQGLTLDTVQFRAGPSTLNIDRQGVAGIVWLQGQDDAASTADADADADANAGTDAELVPGKGDRAAEGTAGYYATLSDGSQFTLRSIGMRDTSVCGQHADLGDCRLPVSSLLKLRHGPQASSATASTAIRWQLRATPEPDFGISPRQQGTASPLVGQDVSDFEITMLDGARRTVGDYQNRVLVLDFWAGWCAPCVKSMPKLQAVWRSFPEGTVDMIAVNQRETKFDVQVFVNSRDLDVPVALDPQAKLGDQFQVQSIPHTVVIRPDGKVHRVFVGAPADLHKSVWQAISDVLPSTD